MWAYFGVGISRLVTWVLLRWKLGTFDFERYNHISPRIWTCMIFVQKWCNNLKIHPILNSPKILSTSMWILSQPAPANSRSVVATTVTSWAASVKLDREHAPAFAGSFLAQRITALTRWKWDAQHLTLQHDIWLYLVYQIIILAPDPSSTCSVLALASSESMSSQQT